MQTSISRRRSLPLHVLRKTAKGRVYYYYDTGVEGPRGRRILKRLPDVSDPGFGDALAGCNGARTRRSGASSVLTLHALIDLYERSPAYKEKAVSTQKNYRIYLAAIAKALNTAPADQVERRDVVLLMDRMAERPGAANMMVRTVGAL